VREGLIKENPARLVPTPKLPKRIPSILSAEEMNGFLNQLAEMGPGVGKAASETEIVAIGKGAAAKTQGKNQRQLKIVCC